MGENGQSLEARVMRASLASRLFGVTGGLVSLGPYQLLRRIGAGGMGTVFEACDGRSGQRLALKVLQHRGLQGLQRLKREFRSLADVQHPNLIRLYELSVHDDEPFLTMELIRGVPLSDYVRPDDVLNIERLDRSVRQLIDAISTLHAAGILHCDLKPANVLVQPDDRLVLLDFGLARALDEQSEGLFSGTPAYLAPERLRGDPATGACDWYSAGVLLRQLVTGMPAEAARHDETALSARAVSSSALADRLLELCSRLLAAEPERRPGASELRAWVGLQPAPPPRPLRPTGDGNFFGREVELERLGEAFAGSAQGRCVVVHLRGEPGIGKTVLVQSFIERLRSEHSVSVLSSRCHERESIPYNAIDGLADALAQRLPDSTSGQRASPAPEGAAELVRLFPILSAALSGSALAELGTPGADLHRVRNRAFSALRSLLAELARDRPLVVHLDDLQWGDADSAHLLQELLKADAPAPLLLIASYRHADSESSACVKALLDAKPLATPDVLVLDLAPLSQADALGLARALGASRFDDRQLEALSRESAGSPLFLRALVQHHAAGEPFQHTSLQQLLHATLRQLERPSHELLQLLALANRPLQREFLLRAARAGDGGSEIDWHDQLLALQRVGLLRIVPGARDGVFESYHDRLREAVTAMIEAGIKRGLHARLAEAETAAPAPDPEFLAHQYEGAQQLARAAGFAELAGDRAFGAIALDRAAELYAMALRCREGERPQGLVEKLADAAAYAGRSAVAAPLYLEAAGELVVERPRSLRLHMRGADMLLRSGQFARSTAVVRPVLHAVGVRFLTSTAGAMLSIAIDLFRLRRRGLAQRARRAPTALEELRGEICFALGYPLTTMGQMRALALQLRSMLYASECGTDAQLARSLAGYAWLRATFNQGTNEEQDALLAQAWELARRGAENAEIKGWVLGLRAATHFTRGDYRGSLESNREAQAWLAAHCVDTTWRLAELDIGAGLALVNKGDLLGLRRVLDVASQRTLESGSQFQAACIRALANPVLLARDESEVALKELEELSRVWPSSSLSTITTWRRICTLLYRGEALAAWNLMLSEWSGWTRAGYQRVQPWNVALPLLKSTVALACIAERGPKASYLRRVAADIAWLRRQKAPLAEPSCALLEASLRYLDGDHASSARYYAQAAEGFAGFEISSYEMVARVRQAELIDERQAAPLRERAQEWFRAQGIVRPDRWIRMYAPLGRDTRAQLTSSSPTRAG